MPTNTFTPIAEVTLSASSTEVTISNIPNTYRDLVIIGEVTGGTGAHGGRTRLNGDSGSNYEWAYFSNNVGYNGTTTGDPIWGFRNTSPSVFVQHIFDYAVTQYRKTILGQAGSLGGTTLGWARWSSANAVTSVTFSGQGQSFAAGSTFKLFGIVS